MSEEKDYVFEDELIDETQLGSEPVAAHNVVTKKDEPNMKKEFYFVGKSIACCQCGSYEETMELNICKYCKRLYHLECLPNGCCSVVAIKDELKLPDIQIQFFELLNHDVSLYEVFQDCIQELVWKPFNMKIINITYSSYGEWVYIMKNFQNHKDDYIFISTHGSKLPNLIMLGLYQNFNDDDPQKDLFADKGTDFTSFFANYLFPSKLIFFNVLYFDNI